MGGCRAGHRGPPRPIRWCRRGFRWRSRRRRPTRRIPMRRSLGAAIVLAAAFPAFAQSINVDFGAADSIPPTATARWGAPDVERLRLALAHKPAVPAGQPLRPADPRQHLQQRRHRPVDAPRSRDDRRRCGAHGRHAAVAHNPTDACIWVEHLLAGTYQVVIYAMTPDDPTNLSRVRVDSGSPGPTMVGGSWPGCTSRGSPTGRFTVACRRTHDRAALGPGGREHPVGDHGSSSSVPATARRTWIARAR